MAGNLAQILNFKANFHQEFELFSPKKVYANNDGYLKSFAVAICPAAGQIAFEIFLLFVRLHCMGLHYDYDYEIILCRHKQNK